MTIEVGRYFDAAAGRPPLGMLLDVYAATSVEHWSNPSGIYTSSRAAKDRLWEAREQVARKIGANSDEILFPSGASEANSLVIRGVLDRSPSAKVVISAADHSSVHALAGVKDYKDRVRVCPVDTAGLVQLDEVEALIDIHTELISIVLVTSETGVRQPIKDIAYLVKKVNEKRKESKSKPIYLHSDASQAAQYIDLSVARLGVDSLTINTAKIGAAKKTAILYKKRSMKINPLIYGGEQEHGLRSGTESVALSAMSSSALARAIDEKKRNSAHVGRLRDGFEKKLLQKYGEDSVEIAGANTVRAPHISGLFLHGIDAERLTMKLDELGIAVSTGSACAANSQSYSSLLRSMGRSDSEIRSFLRVSFLPEHTEKNVLELIEVFFNAYEQVKGFHAAY